MIQYEGMKAEESKSTDFGQLPVGAYVGKVISAKIDGFAPDQSLVLALDVIEGEYTGFYMNKYNASKKAGSKYGEIKYKGTYRLRIPNPQNKNAMYPESDVSRMNDMIFRFEKSNPGFHWDCDEKKLAGLIVGFRTQEDEYNGNTFTRIGGLATADDVRQGLVKGMSPRKRQATQDPMMPTVPTPSPIPAPVDSQTGMPVVDTDELPF